MFSPHRLNERRRKDEIMDDPQLEASRHVAALDGLARLNLLSGSARLVWKPILDLTRRRGLEKVRVLDVATGSGDLPIALWHRAQKARLDFEIHGVDVSERALDYARERAAAARARIGFSQLDVLEQDLPDGFDVVVSSLFLHHLSADQGRHLLSAMAGATRHLVVISDLVRNRRGLLLTEFAVRIFTRSDVVHIDGPRSVRAAFSRDEVGHLALEAGLEGVSVKPRWPCRFVLTWTRTAGE